MQGPRGDEALQGLDGYEQMVDTFADKRRLIGGCGVRWASQWSVG
jgi:hypothetical protein